MFFRSIVISLFFLASFSILNAQSYTDYKSRATGIEDPFPNEWTTVDNVLARATDFMKDVKNEITPLEQKKISLLRAEYLWDAIDPSFIESIKMNPWNESLVKKYNTMSEEIETFKLILFPQDFSVNEDELRDSILAFIGSEFENMETKDLVNKFLEKISEWDHSYTKAIIPTFYYIVTQSESKETSPENRAELVYQALLLEIYILDKIRFYGLAPQIAEFMDMKKFRNFSVRLDLKAKMIPESAYRYKDIQREISNKGVLKIK